MGETLALVELVELSDVGRVRHHNEDRALRRPPLFAVADGMGGAKAGEVAAQMAVDEVAALPAQASVEEVRDAVQRANGAIHGLAASDPEKTGMGTTLTAGLFTGAALSVLHVGDSRAYLWRDGELTQITDDHSVVAELMRRGSLSADQALTHPHRNVITRALGAERTVSVDIITQPLQPGDVVLLCSDGLSSYVRDPDIADTLSEASDLGMAARGLVDLANRAGGADNVTVVLARVDVSPDGAAGTTAQFDTVEEPRPASVDGRTAEMRVLGGVHGHAGVGHGDLPPSAPPRVLEPAGRRRRLGWPIAAIAAVLLVLAAAAAAVVSSGYHVVREGPDDSVWVMRGLPLPAIQQEWQPVGGVSAAQVEQERPGALTQRPLFGSDDQAVALAVELVWGFGLPQVEVPTSASAVPDTLDPTPQAPQGDTPADDAAPADGQPEGAPAETTGNRVILPPSSDDGRRVVTISAVSAR